jgi:membrane carboxypeptidase/penicillin-binding protein PbpC
MKLRLPRWLSLPLRCLAVAGAAFALVIALVPKPHLLDRASFSPCYVDREGRLLRLGLAEDDRYRSLSS